MPTFRVYLRWPERVVTNKTVTESRAVAEAAFAELEALADVESHTVEGALGIALTEDMKQVKYRRLRDEDA